MEQSGKRQTYILISLPEFEIIINHKGKRLTLEWSYRCIDWCKLTEEWWIWLWKVSCNRPFLINYCSLEAAILDVFYVYIIMWGDILRTPRHSLASLRRGCAFDSSLLICLIQWSKLKHVCVYNVLLIFYFETYDIPDW